MMALIYRKKVLFDWPSCSSKHRMLREHNVCRRASAHPKFMSLLRLISLGYAAWEFSKDAIKTKRLNNN